METQTKAKQEIITTKNSQQKITTFLWFNDNAEEAVYFYTSLFKNSGIKSINHYGEEGAKASGRKKGTIMTLTFQLDGQEFVSINGGPDLEITPAISLFVNCHTREEITTLWEKLSNGGTILMELDKYPFSEKYGWVQDKFGVSWQLILSDREQKIAPCFMFAGDQHKKAEEAIHFYISIFQHSNIIQLERYKAGEGPEGAVVHAKFTLNGQEFIAMDSHIQLSYNFNPAISLVVNCQTQEEIDYYWKKLSEGGDETAQQCGWLQDKFGISWQIVPDTINEMLSDLDPKKSSSVMQAILQMKKINMNTLIHAYKK